MVISLPKLDATSATGLNAVALGFLVAAVVTVVAVAAELLHYVRVRRVAPLAFGPHRGRMFLAAVAPFVRVGAMAAAAWGLTVLLVLAPKSHKQGEIKESEFRHLVLVLDVSRSMEVEDAGPGGKQKRSERAADLIQSFFERVQAERYKTTVIAVASEAKPVVLDTTDREVIRNVLTELPMRHAFKPGETNMFAGLEEAAKVAKPWPPGSAVLMVVTDGDTVPTTGMPKIPASIGGNVVMVGVGNPTVGKSLGGHTTRQDASTLRQVATRLNGAYHDGNEKQLSTELISRVDEKAQPKGGDRWTAREYALLCVGSGTGVLALLPVLLALLGTGWEPGRRPGASFAHRFVRERGSRV
ncbi:von Willebrand factor type A OS=Isosphaera pallida (strain ATCC 43644 / DSM 9630 / IS1B) GN=Isop_3571 PE=4 SV=1: VWA_2 [Gemmata massiliana]|uniref:VWFA domain-containing protein n=1 Tax=Gemmata massiliana TaxID=1210884 RepID=A0A6P2D3V8_9BACT|nr:vWA domain-containing protein [Gemmata massiliana]VTR95176.1 von Willebrand factor type A OS=Isosphaera pallida (strain ATCC 43644 / DSM 9630 / IS1B) GN=Isop_3571 PE=4 SV=1: VWA_2 [Gemmata massiliana]